MKRALIATLLLAGCEQPRTELMIGVVTDIRAPNVIDGAQLIVTRAKDGFVEQQVSWQISGLPNQPFNLPGSYGIYSDGEEVKLDVVLTGLKGENPVVSRRAVLNLVEGKTLFFRMGMTAGCAAKSDCLPTESCVEGVCRDVVVNSLQLPDFRPEIVGALTCNSGPTYIDTGTGAPLPMAPGAEDCPIDLCVEGTCLKPMPTSGGSGGSGGSDGGAGMPVPPPDGGTSGGGDGGTMTAVSQVPCTGNHVATITATDGTNAYMPGNVFINIGDVVLIQMPAMHSVTPVGFPGFVGPGQTNCYQFHAPGPYDFKCGTGGHPEMGVINVNP